VDESNSPRATLRQHLAGTLKDVTEARDDLLKVGIRKALYLSTSFQTGVYNCQLGKLRDVFDPLVLEVIRFYDQRSNLERVKDHLSRRSFELAVLTGSNSDKEKEQPLAQDYVSSLEEAITRINTLLLESEGLTGRLTQSLRQRTRGNPGAG